MKSNRAARWLFRLPGRVSATRRVVWENGVPQVQRDRLTRRARAAAGKTAHD